MRPSPKTSIFAPTRCGVEPVRRDDGDERRRLAALERVGDGGEDFLVHLLRLYGAGRAGWAGARSASACTPAYPALPAVTAPMQLADLRSARCRRGTPRVNDARAAGRRRACRCRGRCRRSVMPSGTSNGTLGAAGERALHELRPDRQRRLRAAQADAAGCRRSPTQTTVSSSGVKPTNQASRRSLVVPVLPAASSVKPARARAARRCLR